MPIYRNIISHGICPFIVILYHMVYAHLSWYYITRCIPIYAIYLDIISQGVCPFIVILYHKVYAHLSWYYITRCMPIYRDIISQGVCPFIVILYHKVYAYLSRDAVILYDIMCSCRDTYHVLWGFGDKLLDNNDMKMSISAMNGQLFLPYA